MSDGGIRPKHASVVCASVRYGPRNDGQARETLIPAALLLALVVVLRRRRGAPPVGSARRRSDPRVWRAQPAQSIWSNMLRSRAPRAGLSDPTQEIRPSRCARNSG